MLNVVIPSLKKDDLAADHFKVHQSVCIGRRHIDVCIGICTFFGDAPLDRFHHRSCRLSVSCHKD